MFTIKHKYIILVGFISLFPLLNALYVHVMTLSSTHCSYGYM